MARPTLGLGRYQLLICGIGCEVNSFEISPTILSVTSA